MTDTVRITASGRDFQYAVKLIKKRGGTFNPSTKTWTVPAGSLDGSEYVTKVSEPSIDDIYRDWSDNPNSIY